MLEFYTSGVLGQKSNTLYPTKIEVTDEASLKEAVSHDYVCATYTDFRRGNSQFIESNCLAFDVDNDGSDDERTWINPQTVMETFPGVTVAFHFSRHHMIDKKYIDVKTGTTDKTVKARPRFHVFFEINPLKNYSE